MKNKRKEKEKKRDDYLRQFPQTRRFLVTCIRDEVGFSSKFHAIARISLCPQRTDSMVSSSFNGLVTQLESYR